MKNISNNRGILLGIGLLGFSTLTGLAVPSLAQPRRDVKKARRDVKEARKDLKQEKRDLRQQTGRRAYQGQNRPPIGGNRNFGRAYTGTVTSVRSTQSFDINVAGRVYNVYTVARSPRSLSTGDLVRVNGVQQYNNDIRNARVSIVRNR